MTLKIVSLFCGCGGFDVGALGGFEYLGEFFEKNDVEVVRANDIWKDACDTYRYNLGNHVVCGDISNIPSSDIPDCDIVAGGFPCQDFSVAGKRRGTNSERGNLYLQMKRVIKDKKPKVFIAENVKGILSINDGETIKQIVSEFTECGYAVRYHLIKAYEHGVPQTRERVIIVGIRNDIGTIYDKPPKKLNKILTAHDAIDDLWGQEETKIYYNHNEISKAKKGNGQGNRAITRLQPGPTIRAEHHGNIEFHYNETRRLSVRECARIQSFPDKFLFVKSGSSNYKQIGNAIPPLLARHLVRDIIEKVFIKPLTPDIPNLISHKLHQEDIVFSNTF